MNTEEVQTVNTCDPGAIKRVIDDTIAKFIFEEVGFQEDTVLSNVKLFLGLLSVTLALTAQFYPAPFPENYYVLLICCPLYFVCSNILQYMASYMEKDFILWARSKDRFNPVEIQVFTKLPKYSYTITIGICVKGHDYDAVTMSKSVENWFDSNGNFYEQLFLEDFRALFKQHSSGKKIQ